MLRRVCNASLLHCVQNITKRVGVGSGRTTDFSGDSMRVAIVSINYSPDMTGISVYTTGMAKYLAASGNEVLVYTGFSYYPRWAKALADHRVWSRREQVDGVNLRRSYLYVPKRPSAIKRMAHELSFVLSATIGYLFGPRADCTIVVMPPLFLGVPIALLAKLKGSRLICHVQDLQPDAAVELGMLKRGPLTRLFYAVERLTYRLADRVSTIGEGMRRRIVAKGVPAEKTFILRNWANDDLVSPARRATGLRAEWALGDRFVVLYSGNMGVKQGLSSVLACADILRERSDIVFLVVGDGGEKADLAQRAEQMKLDNLMFKPLQPQEKLAELLATCDLSVIPQKPGVTDIVLPSKLGNILGSARPVLVAARSSTELARMVIDGGFGIVVEPGDAQQMADAVLALRSDPQRCDTLGQNGRRYMEKHLARRVVLHGLTNELVGLVLGETSSAEAMRDYAPIGPQAVS